MKHFTACIKAAPPLGPGLGGVYLLAAPGGLCYVGQTVAGFDRRWQEHLDDLRRGYHVNDALRAAWKAHGDLHATALWIGPKSQAVTMERWYMSELRRRGFVLANERQG